MPSHHNNSPNDPMSEIILKSQDLTVIVLNGHRLIEDLLEEYVIHIFQNQRALDAACLTFEQKLDLVLADIDLPSWRDDDDVDYMIAKEMLGCIKPLNRLRHMISQQIINCIQPGTPFHHSATPDIKSQIRQCLDLQPNVTDKELMEEAQGHVLCLHAYLAGFMESTFEEDGN